MPTRRRFLQLSALAGAGATLAGSSARLLHAQGGPLPGRLAPRQDYVQGPLEPFPLSEVRLLPGPFRTAEEINARWMETLVPDRLLYVYRVNAGLATTATPYGGWEAPEVEIRGEFSGHYLSACANAYAGTGNQVLKRNADAVIAGMAACQKANGNGYVSGFPTSHFDRLARGQEVWAPFYVLHKIIAGNLDMYLQTGNEQALAVAEGLATWVGNFFGSDGLSDGQRQRMLRTEYGGMNEGLVNLYAITGKEQYLRTAHLFEQPSILDPLAARRDDLQGLHANTNVPKMIGAARMYEVTGDARYREIAQYFQEEVLAARSYAIGNTSEDEHWRTAADNLSGTLTNKNAECCVAYNLLKLDRHIWSWTGDPRWMDRYERTLWNARLGTQHTDGTKQYFFPLAAGYWRVFSSPEDTFWCCVCTGAEDFAKFGDTIYAHRGSDVYVNQFIASELTWKDEGLTLRQETSFPEEAKTRLRIAAAGPGERTILVRVPHWVAAQGAAVTLNGRTLEVVGEPGSYVALRRVWKPGDLVELALPMELRTEPLPGAPNTVAALYGPLVLAGDMGPGPTEGPTKFIRGGDTSPKDVPPPAPLPQVAGPAAEWLRAEGGSGLNFSARTTGSSGGGSRMRVKPMYQITDEKYSVYWQGNNG